MEKFEREKFTNLHRKIEGTTSFILDFLIV